VSFLYTELTPSRICYHFTIKYLYVGYNDVELIEQVPRWDALTIRR
jgi:hypothetical protein